MNINGVGPDTEIETNDKGVSQSKMFRRYDLLPPIAISDVAEILHNGAKKYGAWSFLQISADDHLNHTMQHLFAYIAGDTQEGDKVEHIKHALCRLMFCLECIEIGKLSAHNCTIQYEKYTTS